MRPLSLQALKPHAPSQQWVTRDEGLIHRRDEGQRSEYGTVFSTYVGDSAD